MKLLFKFVFLLNILPSIIFCAYEGKEDYTFGLIKKTLLEQLADLDQAGIHNFNVEIACKKPQQENLAIEAAKVVAIEPDRIDSPQDDIIDEIKSLEENFITSIKTHNHSLLESCLAKEKFICDFHNERDPDKKTFQKLVDLKMTSGKVTVRVHNYIKMSDITNYSENINTTVPILLQALHIGNGHALETLVNAQADVNAVVTKKGDSYLHLITLFDEIKMVKTLIDAKPHLNDQNNDGQTPLCSIARHFYQLKQDKGLTDSDRKFKKEVFELLLSAGANPYIKDNNGHSPLDYLNRYDKFYYQSIFQNYQRPKENQKYLEELHELCLILLKKHDKVLAELKDISSELLTIQQHKESLQSLWRAENIALMQRQSELEKDFNTNNQDQEK